MNAPVPFDFNGAAVRVIDRDGEPWFVLADVCRVLELANSRDAAARLDTDEKADVGITDTSSSGVTQQRQMTIINESGLYSLILTSRKPEAKAFKKWVTSEVLPKIRKTGSYVAAGTPDPMKVLADPAALRGLLLSYSERVETLESTVAAQAPKVAALDRIATADGALCITDAAKALQQRPKELFAWLQANGWIYRRPGGTWLGYQAKTSQSYLEHKVRTITLGDGSNRVSEQVLVTAKGLARLSELLAQPVAA